MDYFTIRAREDKHSLELSETIRKQAILHGMKECDDACDVVFVVGGDGTFLKTVHEFMDRLDTVSFYGIHTGTLGFLMDFQESNLDQYLDRFFKGEVREVKFPLLKAVTSCGEYFALNEIRVENIVRTQQMDIYIDDLMLEKYRGTGMCISGQLGSTAYNRSIGGAVIEEGVGVLQMSEISGIHHRAYRSLGAPLIMKDSHVVTLKSNDFKDALLGYDSSVIKLDNEEEVKIMVSKKCCVKVLRGANIAYFDRLHALF